MLVLCSDLSGSVLTGRAMHNSNNTRKSINPTKRVILGFCKAKKEEFFISTSLTHLWAWKAHEYWAEDSDLCLPTGHLEVTFF